MAAEGLKLKEKEFIEKKMMGEKKFREILGKNLRLKGEYERKQENARKNFQE